MQKHEITITRKVPRRGEDGHKVVSVRMKDETISQLDELSVKTNRSRNELINILLTETLANVTVDGEEPE